MEIKMNKPISQLAVMAVLLLGGMGASVQQSPAATALMYDVQMQGTIQSYGGVEKIGKIMRRVITGLGISGI